MSRRLRLAWLAGAGLVLARVADAGGQSAAATPAADKAALAQTAVIRQRQQIEQLNKSVAQLESQQQQANRQLGARDQKIAELQRQLQALKSTPAAAASVH